MRARVVISRCIDFDSCRYNGQVIRAGLREDLARHVDLVPVCPELEIGLGVPRDPVRLVRGDDGPRMVQPATGRDLTAEMNEFARGFLDRLGPVDGFVLKSRSPSCDPGSGLFAARVHDAYPDVAVADEAELQDPRSRGVFLERVRAHASRRDSSR